ncbi:MAG TPA: hypothetical protein VF556_13370 [Pyrinomonadaceae bacterium]|jgi:hypothetical protein
MFAKEIPFKHLEDALRAFLKIILIPAYVFSHAGDFTGFYLAPGALSPCPLVPGTSFPVVRTSDCFNGLIRLKHGKF